MQAWVRGVGAMVAAALAVAGCGGGDEFTEPTESPERICDKVVDECQQQSSSGGPLTRDECLSLFGQLRLPSGCTSAMSGSTCVELGQQGGPLDVCFPPCDGQGATCLEQGVRTCQSGRTYDTDCDAVCANLGRTWTGACGAEYNGQQSSTGQPVCWCSA